MPFPFITRAHHQEVVEAMRAQVAERDQRLRDVEGAHHRLLDAIFARTYGTQLYDSLPKLSEEPEPETTETDIERREREFREAHDEDIRVVKAKMRTSRSQVPRLLEEIRRREELNTLQPVKLATTP